MAAYFSILPGSKSTCRKAEEHIKRKLPSMYHQFKQLADLDITKEPMEVGPTTHYMMGGIRVDGDSQMSNVPGLFAAGEAAAGLHGANRLGGNSLSDLVVFGRRAGRYAAEFAKSRESDAATVDNEQLQATAKAALKPFDRGAPARIPTRFNTTLQEAMQDLVGIVRTESEMQQALDIISSTARARGAGGHHRPPPVQQRVAHRHRSAAICYWCPRPSPAPRSCEKRAGAPNFAKIFPTKMRNGASTTSSSSVGADGAMQVEKRALPAMPDQLQAVIQEMK